MLWYLHFCAVNGVTVVAYRDAAVGTMVEDRDGGGRFTEVVLRPRVRIARGTVETARALHAPAHEKCFLASSVNFPVRVEPTIEAAGPTASGPGSP
jgi:organic hydroperoxide reductase OsmC/OhrA